MKQMQAGPKHASAKHASAKHASMEQLLALRDGQLLDAGIRQHVEACATCRKSLENIQHARDALNTLADPAPDMDLWERIVAERSQERVPATPAATTTTITAVAATVSVIAVATVLAVVIMRSPPGEFDVNPVSEVTPGSTSLNGPGSNGPGSNGQAGAAHLTVTSLQQRSQELESMLAQLGPRPSVQSLRDTNAVESLQSSIALIDYRLGQLEHPDDESSDTERQELWQRRVELMESLLTVRVAADRRNSI